MSSDLFSALLYIISNKIWYSLYLAFLDIFVFSITCNYSKAQDILLHKAPLRWMGTVTHWTVELLFVSMGFVYPVHQLCLSAEQQLLFFKWGGKDMSLFSPLLSFNKPKLHQPVFVSILTSFRNSSFSLMVCADELPRNLTVLDLTGNKCTKQDGYR